MGSAERNVISGNHHSGVYLEDAGTKENLVAGNFIGTDLTGANSLGNAHYGVAIVNAANNRIGDPNSRNVISGNNYAGIWIHGTNAADNLVAGNRIGTNETGTVGLGNATDGIRIESGASSNRIAQNLVSGNRERGINIYGAGTSNNIVSGNLIGTDGTGTATIGNGWDGVHMDLGATANVIGTDGDGIDDVAERNVVSGNGTDGVAIFSAETAHNIVAGNFIGTDITGTASLGNTFDGVVIADDASSNRIQTNVISGNNRHGINISGDENEVAGNLIGTDTAGTSALGNAAEGIVIHDGARLNRIGTNGDGQADTAERNVISGNGGNGIGIWVNGPAENVVAGNFIGTDITGTLALGNGVTGVALTAGARSNQIGSDGDGVADAAERNVISANSASGVFIADAGTEENVVAGGALERHSPLPRPGRAAHGRGW